MKDWPAIRCPGESQPMAEDRLRLNREIRDTLEQLLSYPGGHERSPVSFKLARSSLDFSLLTLFGQGSGLRSGDELRVAAQDLARVFVATSEIDVFEPGQEDSAERATVKIAVENGWNSLFETCTVASAAVVLGDTEVAFDAVQRFERCLEIHRNPQTGLLLEVESESDSGERARPNYSCWQQAHFWAIQTAAALASNPNLAPAPRQFAKLPRAGAAGDWHALTLDLVLATVVNGFGPAGEVIGSQGKSSWDSCGDCPPWLAWILGQAGESLHEPGLAELSRRLAIEFAVSDMKASNPGAADSALPQAAEWAGALAAAATNYGRRPSASLLQLAVRAWESLSAAFAAIDADTPNHSAEQAALIVLALSDSLRSLSLRPVGASQDV